MTRKIENIYQGTDLGASYSKERTSIKVWAPTASKVFCELLKDGNISLLAMTKEELGVWCLFLEGDYEYYSYVYHVYFGEYCNKATDPYAISSSPNHERTVIIDLNKTKIDHRKSALKPLNSYTDAIIYELHVRDFSIDESSGMMNKGKFLGLTEENTYSKKGLITGIDYIADLGVTHIQLLPVYDFGSVDEMNPLSSYNWGYDPVQYNVPEGSYALDVMNPYSRVIDLKKAIAHIHSKGLRVIMDVVYNHMYDKDASSFEKIVPGYYFRQDEKGQVSNGSFCGNDMDSTQPMMRQFLLQSTKFWMEEYGFDGFRFDLMGILDIETMNQIAKQTLEIDNNAMIYGEGWNMPTFLEDSEKATMMNHTKMPHIGHFSDIFREKIKGGTLRDKFHEGGYGSGDLNKVYDAMHLLRGTVLPIEKKDGQRVEPYFVEPKHTLNYVECHDNHTLWDKLEISLKDEPEELRIKRQIFITQLILISQGIAFLHGGQEFLRTKQGEHNSYISPDSINAMDWKRRDQYSYVTEHIKDFIRLRNNYKVFRLDTTQEIQEFTTVELKENNLIDYSLFPMGKETQGYLFSKLKVLINPNTYSQKVLLNEEYRILVNNAGYHVEGTKKQEVEIEPLEIIVLISQ